MHSGSLHGTRCFGRYVTIHRIEGGCVDGYSLAGTTNGLFRAETMRATIFHAGPFKTSVDVESTTARWVDWYNSRSLHSRLGCVGPAEYEAGHYAALNRESAPV